LPILHCEEACSTTSNMMLGSTRMKWAIRCQARYPPSKLVSDREIAMSCRVVWPASNLFENRNRQSCSAERQCAKARWDGWDG
jgi:hypothetical protein